MYLALWLSLIVSGEHSVLAVRELEEENGGDAALLTPQQCQVAEATTTNTWSLYSSSGFGAFNKSLSLGVECYNTNAALIEWAKEWCKPDPLMPKKLQGLWWMQGVNMREIAFCTTSGVWKPGKKLTQHSHGKTLHARSDEKKEADRLLMSETNPFPAENVYPWEFEELSKSNKDRLTEFKEDPKLFKEFLVREGIAAAKAAVEKKGNQSGNITKGILSKVGAVASAVADEFTSKDWPNMYDGGSIEVSVLSAWVFEDSKDGYQNGQDMISQSAVHELYFTKGCLDNPCENKEGDAKEDCELEAKFVGCHGIIKNNVILKGSAASGALIRSQINNDSPTTGTIWTFTGTDDEDFFYRESAGLINFDTYYAKRLLKPNPEQPMGTMIEAKYADELVKNAPGMQDVGYKWPSHPGGRIVEKYYRYTMGLDWCTSSNIETNGLPFRPPSDGAEQCPARA